MDVNMNNFPPEKCTACGACINTCPVNAISWKISDHKIEMPEVNKSLCLSCGKCIKVCPQNSEFQGRYPQKCYAAWLKDKTDLEKSSSGGAARAFSRCVLEDGGIVFGCAFQNSKVKHISVRTLNDLELLSGSKYVWSDTERTYSEVKEALKEGKKVLYIGTPCQIDGLKYYLGDEIYENLFLVDLICHGVPPASYINDYVESVFGEKPETVSFRNREGFVLCGVTVSGKSFEYNPQSKNQKYNAIPYIKAYISGLIYRENCHTCRYANPERVSDITIGDFWGIKKDRLPNNAPELISVMYVNSEKGKQLLSQSSSYLHLVKLSVVDGIFAKDNMKKAQMRPDSKNEFYRLLESYGFNSALQILNEQEEKKEKSFKRRLIDFRFHLERNISTFLCNILSSLTKKNYQGKKLIQITTIEERFLRSNYGTLFQHYALRTFLKQNGFAVCRNSLETNAYTQKNESYIWWRNQLVPRRQLFYLGLIIAAKIGIHPLKGSTYFVRKQKYLQPMYFRRFYTKYISQWREYPERTPDVYLIGGDQVFHCGSIDTSITI